MRTGGVGAGAMGKRAAARPVGFANKGAVAVRRSWSALLLCVGLALSVAGLGAPAGAHTKPPPPPSCTPWAQRTVASGLAVLENLEFDGRGGMWLSSTTYNGILRLTPDGKTSVFLAGVKAPGGLRLRDGRLYFNTGNAFLSGIFGIPDGTLDYVDLRTGTRATATRGLTMPNGLVFLPNGDAVVSRDVGRGTGMTRIPADDTAHPQVRWVNLDDTNGMAVDPSGRWLYTVETFKWPSRVYRISIHDPSRVEVVAQLGWNGIPKGLDDMTIDGRGNLYIAANLAGQVIRVDPYTGSSCVIASGLWFPSSVKFGRGPGWSSHSLYVTGFDGRVRELTPPRL